MKIIDKILGGRVDCVEQVNKLNAVEDEIIESTFKGVLPEAALRDLHTSKHKQNSKICDDCLSFGAAFDRGNLRKCIIERRLRPVEKAAGE